jgi:hypothetical protein
MMSFGENLKDTRLMEDMVLMRQSWDYTAIWALLPPNNPDPKLDRIRRVRVEIHRDFYDEQSYIRASLFDGIQWNFLVDVPFNDKSKCFPISHGMKEGDKRVDINLFREDARPLLLRARQIIWLV